MSALAEALRQAAAELGEDHVSALAGAYRSAPSCTAQALAAAKTKIPAVHHDAVDRVNTAWALEPSTPGVALALALDAARLAARLSGAPSVEVVVTGPDSPAVPIRLTSEVVVGMIASATKRVTIVSYSVAKIPAVIDALAEAKSRGVKVNLIFESPEHFEHGGGAHHYAAHSIYLWPPEQRPEYALLHAKAVIVDSREILVTSANLSNLAHQSSLELGLLCRGGGVADRVQRHVDALIAGGELKLAPSQ